MQSISFFPLLEISVDCFILLVQSPLLSILRPAVCLFSWITKQHHVKDFEIKSPGGLRISSATKKMLTEIIIH